MAWIGVIAKALLLLLLLGSGSGLAWYLARNALPVDFPDLFAQDLPRLMVYVSLGLMALVFFFVGFFLSTFYLNRKRLMTLTKDADELRKALSEKQREALAAREEASKTSIVVHSLEQQVRQKTDELNYMKRLSARQDEEIARLQKDAEAIRAAIGALGQKEAMPIGQDSPEPAGAQARSTPQPRPEEPPKRTQATAPSEKGSGPAWKEALDNILDDIDSQPDK